MERRGFLKFLLSMSALGCCGCAKNNFSIIPTKQKFESVSLPICYHCNLNCASCNHFAPIAPKYEVPVEQFEKDIKQLAKLAIKELKSLRILGGEPLLHKKINKIIEIVSEYFPDTKKVILTNGILLDEMSESFWNVCRQKNIILKYTRYSLCDRAPKIEDVLKLKEKYKVRILIGEHSKTYFDLPRLSKIPSKISSCEGCMMSTNDAQLDNGRLYLCPICANIRFFNDYFKEYAIPVSKNDYLNIHEISNINEITEFLNKTKEFSKYCKYGEYKRLPWHLSQRKLSEWYEIDKG